MAPSPESVARFETTAYWCLFSIACWDWVINLSKEWEHIWKRPQWTMAKGLYIFVRYFGLIAFIFLACLFGVQWTEEQCRVASRMGPYLCIWVILGTQLIMLLRCRAIYEGNIWITGIFGTLLFAELIIHHIIIWQTVVPLWLPAPGALKGFCVGQEGTRRHQIPLSVISLYPACVDTVITVLTIYKVRAISREFGYKSTMLTNFARHGILCFLSITLIQITNAIFILQPVVSLQAFFNPNMNLVSQIMGCRLVLSLYHHREESTLSLRSTYAEQRSASSRGSRGRFGPQEVALPLEPFTFKIDDFSHDSEKPTQRGNAV